MRDISKELKFVWDFQETFGHMQTTEITKGTQDKRKLRLNLFLEELGELHKATYENDNVEQLDAVIDMLYILLGSVHYHGLGSMFNEFIAGENDHQNTPINNYPTELSIILQTGQIKDKYIYGNITYSELLMLHVELCSTVLSLFNKLELEGVILNKVFASAFLEVHQSNMSKLDDNGKPIFRADGKILKSKNYFKPNLLQFIK